MVTVRKFNDKDLMDAATTFFILVAVIAAVIYAANVGVRLWNEEQEWKRAGGELTSNILALHSGDPNEILISDPNTESGYRWVSEKEFEKIRKARGAEPKWILDEPEQGK